MKKYIVNMTESGELVLDSIIAYQMQTDKEYAEKFSHAFLYELEKLSTLPYR